jgi:hypothetical protein
LSIGFCSDSFCCLLSVGCWRSAAWSNSTELPELVTVDRLSSESLAHGDILSLGFELEANGQQIERVVFSYRDPLGRARGDFWAWGSDGPAELVIPEDYLAGAYVLASITVEFLIAGSIAGSVTYLSTGVVFYSPSGIGETGSHALDFDALRFSVAERSPAFLSSIQLNQGYERSDVLATVRLASGARHFGYISDASNGSPIGQIPISPEVLVAQVIVPDLTGNSSEEIVVLERTHDGFLRARAKDSISGELIGSVSFDGRISPEGMRFVSTTGDGADARVAVLGVGDSGRPRVQVKRLIGGALESMVFFDPAFQPIGFEVIADSNGNGHPELAVIGVDSEGRVRAQVKDAITGELVSMVWFDRRFSPLFVSAMDLSGDGSPDSLVVLGENEDGIVRAQAKKVSDGTLAGIVRFESGYEVHELVVLPDLDGSGTPELGVLQRDSEGRVRVQVKDAVTAQPISIVPFPRTHEPRGLTVIPGVAGPGTVGLAYLGELFPSRYLLQVRDAATSNLVFSQTHE